MTIIILGHRDDIHAQTILQTLQQQGKGAYLFESHRFPSEIEIGFRPGIGSGALRLPGGDLIDFAQIRAVYWRNFSGVSGETSRAARGSSADVAWHDSMAALRTWMQLGAGTRWYNSWQAYQSHLEKPLQLHAAALAGLKIPRTYIGNNREQILAFCRDEPQAIFKPVYGGAHTERITEKHLAPEHLAKALTQAPITLQQYIPGTNVRTYCFQSAQGLITHTIELHSGEVDFRLDENPDIRVIDTPAQIRAQAQALMPQLALNWTAIDWRRDQSGDYYFLEANPSPMFLGVQNNTGLPLLDTLLQAMQSWG